MQSYLGMFLYSVKVCALRAMAVGARTCAGRRSDSRLTGTG